MQSSIVDHILILKQSLNNCTLEKVPGDHSSEINKLTEVSKVLRH